MQCSRCASVVADSVTVCPTCGNPLVCAVDSYGATSFAPVLPAAQPVAHVAVRGEDPALAATTMAASSPVPPTLLSGAGAGTAPSPRYVVTPAPVAPPARLEAPPPTMHSGPMQPLAPYAPYAPPPPAPYAPPPLAPYPPPPYPMSYPGSVPAQPLAPQGTPGLAIAALVCGLLGWIPLWIGFILCLLAITFGGVVLAQTRPGQHGRGLAITGLVFGLVLLLPAACGL